jgi:hypothetical protein
MAIYNGSFGQVAGLKVIINHSKKGAYVVRTWNERLFSWPWKPWVSKKWDSNAGPYMIDNNKILKTLDTIVCNPITANTLKKEISA